MQTKQYKIQPDKMALLDAETIEFWLEFDEMSFIWGYSEQLFTSVCAAHPQLAALFASKLAEMSAAVDSRTDDDFARPGSFAHHDDKRWLAKLSTIAAKAAPVAAVVAAAPELTREIAAHREGFTPAAPADLLGTGEAADASRDPAKLLPLYLPAPELGQLMLPLFVARSGLFGAGGAKNGTRQVWTTSSPRIINHFSGMRSGSTTLTYTGEELWTGEQELWTNLLNSATTTALGEDVTVGFLDALRAMPDRGDGNNSRDRVRKEGNRLKAGSLTIRTSDPVTIAMMQKCLPENKSLQEADKKKFVQLSFSLLESFTTSTDSITFRISREMRALFGSKLHTWYDVGTYYSLPAAGLSRRLYVLYASHYDCYPLTVAEHIEYLGIKAKTVRNVVGYLRDAHAELQVRRLIDGVEFRMPSATERKGCNVPAFIVKRPNREERVVHVEVPAEEAAA